MKQLVPAARSRLALAALTAGTAIVATIIVLASPGEAAPPANCTYYSDWSRTTVVGRFGKDCCNNNVAWGVKTSHAECSAACLLCVPPPQD
jgi:Family of unknown function (DUF6289)